MRDMPPPGPASVCVRELTMNYGPVAAVRGISFTVEPGEIFGLLGPNGAGKTSTLECILGLRRPAAGSIEIGGIDALAHPEQTKPLVGAQLQFAALQDKITPRQALQLFASFYPHAARVDDLIAQFGLSAKADATVNTLSGGQRQRLFLALAFVNDPSVVVLDEPTAGLDPPARRELHQLITGLRAAGRTVLLSTHDMEEARQLCDHLAILHEGRIVALGSPAELIAAARARPRVSFQTLKPLDPARVAALSGVVSQTPQDSGWLVTTSAVNRTVSALVQALESDGNGLRDLQIHRPSLEDVFIELTGRVWPEASREEEP